MSIGSQPTAALVGVGVTDGFAGGEGGETALSVEYVEQPRVLQAATSTCFITPGAQSPKVTPREVPAIELFSSPSTRTLYDVIASEPVLVGGDQTTYVLPSDVDDWVRDAGGAGSP